MSNFVKIFFLGLAAVVGILVIASVSVNLYLQSQGVQQRIRDAASHAIGRRVSIQNTSYTPWDGVVFNKVTVSNRDGSDADFLEIAKVRFRIPLLPLLQRKVILSSIRIEEPVMTLTQNADGSWDTSAQESKTSLEKLPASKSIQAVNNSSSGGTLPSLSPTTSTTPKLGAPPTSSSSPEAVFPAPKAFPTLPQKIVISKGKFIFITKQGKPTIVAEDIDSKLVATQDGRITGPLTCSRMIVAGSFFFKNLRTSVSGTPQKLDAQPISASIADGNVSGEFRCRFGSRPAFEMRVQASDVSLSRLLNEAGFHAGKSSGSLRGDLWVFNEGHKLEPQGKGSLELQHGEVEPIDFLRQLGHILRVQELELLHLDKAIASFQIQSDRLIFDRIFLASKNILLEGTGPIKFDGRLDIASRLLFNEHLYSQFQGLFGKNFSPSSTTGYHEIGFRVFGHTSHPQTDLLDKLTGIRIRGNVGGFLQNLLGWPQNHSAPSRSPQ